MPFSTWPEPGESAFNLVARLKQIMSSNNLVLTSHFIYCTTDNIRVDK